MIISYNFGTYHKDLGSSVVTYFPHVWEVSDISEFIADIRANLTTKLLFKWCEESHIIPSSLTIYMTVGEHNFRVRMINVREYRQKWEEKYKTNWKG